MDLIPPAAAAAIPPRHHHFQLDSNTTSNHSTIATSSTTTTVSSTASSGGGGGGGQLSRYENQKRRDWNTFGQYLRNHRPPLSLSRCSGAHVLEFLRYLDQFGKTKVHNTACPYFGDPVPPAPCPCPLRQAWGSLDALIGRLRAAYEENGGAPESNPFGARAVRLYLREVRDSQAKARGISYEKKKRKRPPPTLPSSPPPPPPPFQHHQHHHRIHDETNGGGGGGEGVGLTRLAMECFNGGGGGGAADEDRNFR